MMDPEQPNIAVIDGGLIEWELDGCVINFTVYPVECGRPEVIFDLPGDS